MSLLGTTINNILTLSQPKPKGFARVRAALAEESAPVETDVRREADVVRQVRESDMDLEPNRHFSVSTAQSSPSIAPNMPDTLEDIPEDDLMDVSSNQSGLSSSFKQHAMLNSKGKDFWNNFDNSTPPPPGLPRGGSSAMSDISMDTTPPSSLYPHSSAHPSLSNDPPPQPSSPVSSSFPQYSNANGTGPTAAEVTRKVNNKRRRDDDFDLDPSSLKRRAVSPGMSVHNSPVMLSPMQREFNLWGSRPASNNTSGSVSVNEKNGSASGGEGRSTGGGAKRIGFQGMVDTNDGLMKMSIE